jgi:alpha-tubulin suppressor-like RCC1 family protein
LGHGDKRPQLVPKQVELGGLEDECVASISCGSRHTIAVTEEGEVFSWGLGHFGCLGRSFTPFDYDAGAAVASFTGEHALPAQQQQPVERDLEAELAAHLDLLANLSLDDTSDQCIPQLVESLKGIKVVGCSAGHRHSLFLSEEGSLYSCGAGNAGCLGHGDTESQMFPMKIRAFDDDCVRIHQMSAG